MGDVIMGPLGAPSSSEDVVMADAEAPATPSLTVDLPLVDLPTGFTKRIRALPSSTILHVPRQLSPAHDQRGGTMLAWHGSGAR